MKNDGKTEGKSIAELIVSMTRDTAVFERDMKQAARMKKMERAAKKAGKALGKALAAVALAATSKVDLKTAKE